MNLTKGQERYEVNQLMDRIQHHIIQDNHAESWYKASVPIQKSKDHAVESRRWCSDKPLWIDKKVPATSHVVFTLWY